MNPTVSVIVPVYNVAQYLPQCLDSIVRQTYAQLEILLVDDGSTDGSGQLCDEWAASDSRVHVIHKANGGLSDARNAALDVMTGDLVLMVDGDDYIAEDCVQTLVDVKGRTGCDIAIGQWRVFDDKDDNSAIAQAPNGRDNRITVFSRDEAVKRVFYQDTLNNSACSRLFRADLFREIRFPVGMLYEDMAVIYPLLMQVRNVAFTTHIVYHYRQHESSITGHFTKQRTDVLDILEQLEGRVARENPQFLPAIQSRLLSASFNILLLCPDEEQYKPVVDRCWRNICRLRRVCIFDKNVRLKNRLGIIASWAGKELFLRSFRGKMLKKY